MYNELSFQYNLELNWLLWDNKLEAKFPSAMKERGDNIRVGVLPLEICDGEPHHKLFRRN